MIFENELDEDQKDLFTYMISKKILSYQILEIRKLYFGGIIRVFVLERKENQMLKKIYVNPIRDLSILHKF